MVLVPARSSARFSLIWLGRIGALSSSHFVGALVRVMIRLSAGVTSIGGFADSVVLAVVVGILVEAVGMWCRG
jgi:hypothetical protein